MERNRGEKNMTKKKMMIILISVISIFIFLLVGIAQTAQKNFTAEKPNMPLSLPAYMNRYGVNSKNRYSSLCRWQMTLF